MSPRAAFVGVAASLIAMASCGQSASPGTTTTPAPLTVQDYADAYAHAFCDHYDACCRAYGLTPDASRCVARVSAQMQTNIELALGANERFDPAAAGVCVAALGEVAPACFATPQQAKRLDVCRRAFVASGTAAPGESCATDLDCAPSPNGVVSCIGYSMSFGEGTDAGWETKWQCQLRSAPYDGAPCGFAFSGSPAAVVGACDSTDHDPSYTCDPSTNTCVPRRQVGELCNVSDDCVLTAFCNPNQLCAPRVPVGSLCSGDAPSECEPISFCDLSNDTCAVKRPDGVACEGDEQCAGGHCGANRCDQSVPIGTPSFLCAGTLD
jgi:hypothetical protein